MTKTIDVKMAKPSEKDFDRVLFFFQGIEAMLEENTIIESQDDEGTPFEPEAALEWLEKQWKDVNCSWRRVLWAGQVAIDNACDPSKDVLEFKPEILAAAKLAESQPALLDACRFVKGFFAKLDAGLEPSDPLAVARRYYHAPIHAKLDAAIAKAEEVR